jgi:hypothetical protein
MSTISVENLMAIVGSGVGVGTGVVVEVAVKVGVGDLRVLLPQPEANNAHKISSKMINRGDPMITLLFWYTNKSLEVAP